MSRVSWAEGIIVGCAQLLSLAPGVSRSGITMTAGLWRGMTRETAARFSFLLSIPIIGGAFIAALGDAAHGLRGLPADAAAMFAIGFATAALSGYLCIRFFLRYLQQHSFKPFIIYRVALGAFLLIWFAVK